VSYQRVLRVISASFTCHISEFHVSYQQVSRVISASFKCHISEFFTVECSGQNLFGSGKARGAVSFVASGRVKKLTKNVHCRS
jgi:hypothetical protein